MTERIRNFRFESSHEDLQGIWDEWHGLGAYLDRPIPGGVAELERLYGAKWRTKSIQQRVSRQGRICKAMKKKADDENKTIQEVDIEWEKWYVDEFNKNMRRFVEFLQQEGWLKQYAKRGRRATP